MPQPAWMNKDLKRRCVNAAIWAAIILIVSGVFLFIIPEFKKVLDDRGSELPDWIVVIIKISDLLARYWYLIVPPLFLWLAAYVIVPIFFRKPNPSRIDDSINIFPPEH